MRGIFVLILFVLQPHLLFCEDSKRVLSLYSEIDSLNVFINEKSYGQTSKNSTKTYIIEDTIGTGGFGFHKLVVHKELNATHEIYGEKEFKYEPFEPITLTKEKLQPRLKKSLLAQHNGLLQTISLKHSFSSHLAMDEEFIYILTQSRKHVYSKQKREQKDAEYLEIYDAKSLAFVKEILLNEDKDDSFDRAIVLHQGYLYIASQNGTVIFFEKEKGFERKPRILISTASHEGLNRLRAFEDYLFKFGRNGIVELYKDNLHVKTIDTKLHRFKGYFSLEDKRFDKIFDVLYTHEKLFIANDLGDVHVYSLTPTLRYITTLRDDSKEAYDVLALALYADTTLVVGGEKRGMKMYDTKHLTTLPHPQSPFNTNTKPSLYRIEVFHDTLFFTEQIDTPHLYAYDIAHQKRLHDFEGNATHINDFKVSKSLLFSIDDGNLYVWKIKI